MVSINGFSSGDAPIPLDPKYHGHILISVIAICLPLLLFFVLLRLYVRVWTPRCFSLDDGTIRCTCILPFAYYSKLHVYLPQ